MSLAIILIGGWVLATGVVGWSLGRAAAIGDRQDYGLVETGAAWRDPSLRSSEATRAWFAPTAGGAFRDLQSSGRP